MAKYSESEYKRLIGDCLTLSREEEFDAWKRGDHDLLIRSQLPWAMKIASDVCRKLKFEDRDSAFSAANLALVKSVQTFDASKGFRLTTYVFRLVYWYVFDEIECARNQGKDKEYRKRNPFKVRSLSDDYDHVEGRFDGYESIDSGEEIALLRDAIDLLPEYLSLVIKRRFEGVTYADIASECGVTKQAIQQRYVSAKNALRKLLQGKIAA